MPTRRVLCLIVAAGCAGTAPGTSEPVIRDSAGVRLLEYETVAGGGEAWTVAPEPRVSLGALDADPPYQFHQVAGALVLGDGRLVVANGGTGELRWYEADGTFLTAAGRAGDGPGEFRRLTGMALLPGDTILAYDPNLGRFSLFDPAGRFVRSAPLERDGHPGMQYGVLSGAMADGTVLMAGRVFAMEGLGEGPVRASMPAYRYATDGSVRATLGTFYGWDANVVIRERDGVRTMSIAARPFGLTTSIVPVGDGFVSGTPATYVFERYDTAGTPVMVVRVQRAPMPLSADDIADYQERQVEDLEDENARRERLAELADLEYPDTRPAYGYPLMADRAGNVWVREIPSEPETPVVWSVFGPDGLYIGTAATPSGLGIMDIGEDYLLGVWRDDLDVEHLRLYELRKGR